MGLEQPQMIEPIPGVIIDPETRTVAIGGRLMPVGNLMHSERSEGGPRNPVVLDLLEAVGGFNHIQHLRDTPAPPCEESIHIDILAGENGWWVELAVYPDSGEMTLSVVTEEYDPTPITVDEFLARYEEVSRRIEPPELGEFDSPFAGLTPGTWLW